MRLDFCRKGKQDRKCYHHYCQTADYKWHSPVEPVSEEGCSHGCNRSKRIWRCCEKLCFGTFEAHVADNGRHGEFQPVAGDSVGPEDDALEVELPVCQDLFQDRPVDHFLGFLLPVGIGVDGLHATKGDVAELEEFDLIRVEPFGAGWGVREEKEA